MGGKERLTTVCEELLAFGRIGDTLGESDTRSSSSLSLPLIDL